MIIKAPGSLTYRITNFGSFVFLIAAAGIVILSGCKSSESTKENEKEPSTEILAKSEESFNPALYDQSVEVIKREASGNTDPNAGKKQDIQAPSDTIPGFRVQILFTQDIERATELRDSLNAQLPTEYTYIVYDQPYYKVRIGNYTDKLSADSMVKMLVQKGYPDAWAVPDKIITNLPLKTEQPQPPVDHQ